MLKRQNAGKRSLDPIVIFAGLALMSWFAANDQFAAAERIYIPPAPYTLKAVDLVVSRLEDDVRGPRPSDSRRAMERQRYALSDDFPNIAFRLTGAAYGLSIAPPQQVTLLVERDPAEADRRLTNRSDRETIRAHGAEIAGVLVADPEKVYDRALNTYGNKRMVAWIALFVGCASVGIAGLLAWRRFGALLRSF